MKNTKSRFRSELDGSLGAFWQKEAEKELARVKADLDSGRITIDEDGVARNCIGRVLMADMLEKVLMVTDRASEAATTAAREADQSSPSAGAAGGSTGFTYTPASKSALATVSVRTGS